VKLRFYFGPFAATEKRTENTEKSFFSVFSVCYFPWLALRVALIFGIGVKFKFWSEWSAGQQQRFVCAERKAFTAAQEAWTSINRSSWQESI
jgi:hypothetical protein